MNSSKMYTEDLCKLWYGRQHIRSHHQIWTQQIMVGSLTMSVFCSHEQCLLAHCRHCQKYCSSSELREKMKTKRETKMRQEGMTGQTSFRNKSAKTKLQLGVAKQKQAKACDNVTNPPKTKKSKQTTNDASDDASCLYCCEKWSCSRSRDPWIRCTECLK